MPRKNETCFNKTFDVIDIFNEPCRFLLKGERTIRTTLGGILTIALIIFIFTQISQQFVDMFEKNGPQVYQFAELEEDPLEVYLSPENNFFFAISISSESYYNLTESSPFNFPSNFNSYIRDNNGGREKQFTKVYWKPCLEEQFPEELYGPDIFTQNNLNYAYCLAGIDYTNADGTCPDDIKAQYPNCLTPPEFTLKGGYSSTQFDFIQIDLKVCDSTTQELPEGMVCSTDDIETMMLTTSFKINIYYSYSLITPDNYDMPNRTFMDNFYWELNPKVSKVSDLGIDRVTVQDFDDYMKGSVAKNRSFFSIPSAKMREQESHRVTGENLLQINFRRSTLNTVISRTYLKITDILTELGGFAKAMMFIAAFIAIGYMRYKYSMTIANEIFDFQFGPIKDQNNEPKLNLMLSFDHDSNQLVSPPSFLSRSEGFINKPIVDFEERLKEKKKRLPSTEWAFVKEGFFMLCCKKNSEKGRLAFRARELARQSLDIVRLARSLQQFESLKRLLFNKSQLTAFEAIDRPLITLYSKKPLHSTSLTSPLKKLSKGVSADSGGLSTHNFNEIAAAEEIPDYSSLVQYGKLYVAYRHLLEDPNPMNSAFNRKLIGMLGSELLKVFRRVDHLRENDERVSAKEFEYIVKNVLDNPNEEVS